VELIRSIDVPAPERLHSKVQELVAEHESARRRAAPWPLRLGALSPGVAIGGAAAACAAVAVALVLALSGGGASRLTLTQAQALTLSSPTMPAPGESASNATQLDASVEGVAFPYWEEQFGWRSTGRRVDHVAGGTVTTVFYGDARGQQVGYAIVADASAPTVTGGSVQWRGSTPFHLMRANGAELVTWMRNGHLCVVSGRHMSSATLLRLASWNDARSA
jgi:hypothetical protein